MLRLLILILVCLQWVWLPLAHAAAPAALKADVGKVNKWNQFADDLYLLHQTQTQGRQVRTQTRTGGYATHPDFYEETSYYDDKSGVILSRIQRVRKTPDVIHLIEVYVYDEQDRLQRDYLAAYLPDFRNAPIQTLINLHAQQQDLQAFRQFDASGDHIYEQCQGQYAGKAVFLSLSEDDFRPGPYQQKNILTSQVYKQCFAAIPAVVDGFLQPLQNARPSILSVMEQADSYDGVQARIKEFSRLLENEPAHTLYLIQRANLYFVIHDFDLAIMDYTDAIKKDPSLNDAYFGRGMALARNGQVEEGIADLTTYITRQPHSSVAYTKRGVRYLWSGDDKRAEADFRQALHLNPENAEAHDDLGVIYARRGEHQQAITHFLRTVSIDPSYIKGFHNLAMVYFITGQDVQALSNVDKVLAATPQARDSLLLKAEILQQLGRGGEAAAIKQEAEFLPEGNWSEHISVN